MPPDPVLGLLCFVGLILYVAIGALIATVVMDRFDYGDDECKKELASPGEGDGTAWVGFTAVVVLWPALLVLALVLIPVAAITAGPVLVAKHVARYMATTLIEKGKT